MTRQLWIPSTGIERIYVDRLFGQFTYDLRNKHNPGGHSSRLVLLYGENGSGKTTIIRMLFFLLSHIDKQGHKSQLEKIRFKTFEVDFANGTQISAERSDHDEKGFDIRIRREGTPIAGASYFRDSPPPKEPDHKQMVEYYDRQQKNERDHDEVLAQLRSLDLRMIYVADHRRVYTTVPDVFSAEPGEDIDFSVFRTRAGIRRRAEGEDNGDSIALALAVQQVSSWATRQALKGSSQGEEDVNAVYADIITKLAYTRGQQQYADGDFEALIRTLEKQEQRASEFVRFGLMKPLKVSSIIGAVRNTIAASRDVVLSVLEPYVSSLNARLDALEPIRAQLAGFVDTMNSFYRNKSVRLDVNRGMRIDSKSGDRLAPSMLSSGEGQLLFILASTITAKERGGLFMIDEPEISLNVKWQRQLLRALLDLTGDSKIQFVMATHSIELLTLYDEFVLDLEDVSERK